MKKIFLIIGLAIISQCNAQKHTNTMMKDLLKPYPYPTKFAKIKDGDLAYVKTGKGKETILFIHGLSSNADAWSKNIEDLKNNYQCIAVDLPGYGRSYKQAEVFSPSYFAESVNSLMTELRISKVIVVGHSMGGQTAIKLASKYPNLVDKLILIAPAGVEEFTPLEANLMTSVMTSKSVENTTDDQIAKNYQANFYKMPSDVQHMIDDRLAIKNATDFSDHAVAIEKSVKGMLNDKVIDDFKLIKMPTLILFGEQDMLIPNRYLHANLKIKDIVDKAQQEIPHAITKTIPEAGHFLQYEKPKEVNKAIKNFIKK